MTVHIPEELRKPLKIKAIQEETTICALVIRAVEAILEENNNENKENGK